MDEDLDLDDEGCSVCGSLDCPFKDDDFEGEDDPDYCCDECGAREDEEHEPDCDEGEDRF